MCVLMTMISHLKLPQKNYSATAPGPHILLGYDGAQSFETPIIKNQSVTEPSTLIFGGDVDARYFEPPPKQSHCHCTKCPYMFRIWFTAISTQEKNS